MHRRAHSLVTELALEVVSLDTSNEHDFFGHVDQDPLEYYFFVFDWKLYRKDTEIYLALEKNRIEGAMVVYKKSMVHLRGSCKAVETLLEHLDLERVELTAPRECEDVVLEQFKPGRKLELLLMYLEKGEERTHISHELVEISEDRAEEVAAILRDSFPDVADRTTVELVKDLVKSNYWLGIEQDDRVVSIGNTRFADFGSNIGVVATDEAYRNRGLATSVVSALVEEILRRCDKALVHVLSDNGPAIHVYRKVGFRPHNSYLQLKKAKRA